MLPPSSFDGGAPEMRPEIFFAGQTDSTGLLENRSGQPTRRFKVHGEGHVEAEGTFLLVQPIDFEGQASKERTWALTKVDQYHYVGTLTDASGPISAEAYGPYST